MKINDFKQKFIYICIIGVSIFLLFFVVSCCWIGYEVKSRCQEAEREYGGSCTEALINVLKDEKKATGKEILLFGPWGNWVIARLYRFCKVIIIQVIFPIESP